MLGQLRHGVMHLIVNRNHSGDRIGKSLPTCQRVRPLTGHAEQLGDLGHAHERPEPFG